MTGPDLPAGLAAVLDRLRCPQCPGRESPLRPAGSRTVGCDHGHRFDLARQGYLPLLGPRSRTDTGDDADMVAARARFLAAGHFSPIRGAVAELLGDAGAVLEIGAGTGWYLAGTRAAAGIALDSSRYAARRAATAAPQIGAVLADAWAPLPVRDAAVDGVLVVFAPRGAAEIARVLRPGGVLVVVTPDPEHLRALRGPLGMLEVDGGKPARLAEQFDGLLTPVATRRVQAPLALRRDDLVDVVRMGPAARHRSVADVVTAVDALLAGQDAVPTELAVTVNLLAR